MFFVGNDLQCYTYLCVPCSIMHYPRMLVNSADVELPYWMHVFGNYITLSIIAPSKLFICTDMFCTSVIWVRFRQVDTCKHAIHYLEPIILVLRPCANSRFVSNDTAKLQCTVMYFVIWNVLWYHWKFQISQIIN